MDIRKKIYVVNKDGKKVDINVKPSIEAFQGCRAGNHMHKGFEIPINAKLITDKNGEECYLSGVFIKEEVWFASLCYYARTENKFYTVLYDRIGPYL
jgi:hypothetical protein